MPALETPCGSAEIGIACFPTQLRQEHPLLHICPPKKKVESTILPAEGAKHPPLAIPTPYQAQMDPLSTGVVR